MTGGLWGAASRGAVACRKPEMINEVASVETGFQYATKDFTAARRTRRRKIYEQVRSRKPRLIKRQLNRKKTNGLLNVFAREKC